MKATGWYIIETLDDKEKHKTLAYRMIDKENVFTFDITDMAQWLNQDDYNKLDDSLHNVLTLKEFIDNQHSDNIIGNYNIKKIEEDDMINLSQDKINENNEILDILNIIFSDIFNVSVLY